MAEGRGQTHVIEAPSEVREFVREELAWIARFLMRKHKLTVHETRRLLREMLDISV